ncbi:hypothetical protein GCM10023261_16700 [Bartonella jaculi]|uniref:Uncharacterized protein n=1 Tax=Bartonella jaculi TaxID=686226 RepID=A0ABP9NFI3_9HYPH
MGIILDGGGACCIIVRVVLDLVDEGAAGWGGDTLFVVIEGVGVWLRRWSAPSLYARGSGARWCRLALVLKGLGVFIHCGIYLSFCL